MGEVSTREILQELAEAPIGSPALQEEAQRIAHLGPQAKPSFDLREAGRRAAKIWLPSGKTSPSGPAERERRKTFAEQQTDLEDAVEAAGGHRGQLKA